MSILKYLLASKDYTAVQAVLVDCFWPEAEPSAGLHNLRMAIYSLRRSLRGCGPDGSDETVLFSNGHYSLNPALTIVQDVDRFRSAFDEGRRAAAAGDSAAACKAFEEAHVCYMGDYLADTPCEDWTTGQRVALQDMHLLVLSQLEINYRQAGDWERAADCCTQMLGADPYREDAYRELMRCFAECGRMADVQRIYLVCREQLHHDLHLAPARETTALYRRLVNATAAGPPQTLDGPVSPR
jgi:DNA-binding SARP family transcriptional activator